MHVSIGGPAVRVMLTNEFGTEPLTISAATIAVSAGQATIQPATLKPLTFNGKPSVTIPAGAFMVSDTVPMQLAPLSDLTISIDLPAQTISQITAHQLGDQTNYSLEGAHASDPTTPAPKHSSPGNSSRASKSPRRPLPAPSSPSATASQTAPFATRDGNARWPDVLARRLQADKKLSNMAVLNAGISGTASCTIRRGPNAIARFSRDVLDQPGVRYVIILEAINDIGVGYNKKGARETVTADELIGGYMQMVERAHNQGVKVIGATLTPYGGAGYSSPEGEQVRTALNEWIRSSKSLDGVIDFDKVTRDPAHPDTFLPVNDHGDHLHPGDAGYKNMGESIDLKLFTR